MNKKNKITMFRLILSILLIIMLIFPFYDIGIKFPTYIYNGNILIDLKYIFLGILFIITCIFYYINLFSKKEKNITSYNMMLELIANRILINPILIILVCNGMINAINAVVIIICDIIVNALYIINTKENNVLNETVLEKTRDIFLTIGISLTLFYNMPFELLNLSVSDFIVVVATILSVVAVVRRYLSTKNYLNKR